jgi:hypothetical protein
MVDEETQGIIVNINTESFKGELWLALFFEWVVIIYDMIGSQSKTKE